MLDRSTHRCRQRCHVLVCPSIVPRPELAAGGDSHRTSIHVDELTAGLHKWKRQLDLRFADYFFMRAKQEDERPRATGLLAAPEQQGDPELAVLTGSFTERTPVENPSESPSRPSAGIPSEV